MTSLQVTDDMLWKDAPAGLKNFGQEGKRREKRKDENVPLSRLLIMIWYTKLVYSVKTDYFLIDAPWEFSRCDILLGMP